MKILYVHSTQIDSPKANLIQVLSMCNAFVKNSIKIDLVLPEPNTTIKNPSDYIYNKFGIETDFTILFYKKISKNRIIDKYFGSRSIIKILNETDADYVFTRLPKFISIILRKNKNLIFESHNNILHNKYKLIDKYWKNRILSKIKDEKFKLFISISNNLTQYWTDFGIPKEKQISLHDGFNKNMFSKIISKEHSRNELEIPLKEKVVMYTGSLYPDREIENIIFAAKETPDLKYYIIGGPKKYVDKYVSMADEMKITNINFIGYISHNKVATYLSSADYLLALWSRKVPTINYCSPLKVFEYMASGNVIIAHDFPTIREVLEEGKTAFFVDPDDKKDLSEVIKKVSKSNVSVVAQKSKELVFEDYTWEKRASLIVEKLK